MGYVPYKSSSNAWSNIQGEVYGKRFYPLQEGSGSSIKIVSPAQGSVLRAKSELKRQLTDGDSHSPPRKQRKRTVTTGSAKKKKQRKGTKTKPKKKKVVKKKKKVNSKSKPRKKVVSKKKKTK